MAETAPSERSARAQRGAPSKRTVNQSLRLKLIQGTDNVQGTQGRSVLPTPARERYDQDSLTFKQRAFVVAMLKGSTASDAYRHAYDTAKMKPSTIHVEASTLMANPKVSRRLCAGFRRLEEQALRSAITHRRLIEDRLVTLAQSADTDAASLRAIELLGRLDTVQAFKERVEIDSGQDVAPEDLERDLHARLASLFAVGS